MKLNRSVQRAAALLRAAAAEPEGDTASGLARRAGLPWASTVRLLRTLEREGFLLRLPGDRYVLGLGLIRLARGTDQAPLLRVLCRPLLERLAREAGETVHLTLVQPDGSVEVIDEVHAPRLLRTSDWDRPYPLHATSIGKLLLSTYPEERLAAFLRTRLERYARATITDPAALREELSRVRAAGHAEAVDELEDGLAACSVGVSGAGGELIAMVTVSGPSFRFDGQARARALRSLRRTAAAIERVLAGDGAGPTPAGLSPLAVRPGRGEAPDTDSARRRRLR